MADWNSLEDQLKALGVQMGKDKRLANKRGKKHPIEKVVSGEYWQMVTGEVFCHEEFYPMDYIHGSKPLAPHDPIEVLCQWAGAQQLSLTDLQDFVFLDTETSGLVGGTGTYAFEVGLGRFTGDGFRLAQFFMRHPGEEPALLSGLNAFMNGMRAVVTYNGKSFDIPLLNTRYTMMGMDTPFSSVNHFDLLPLARRLWKIRLESRTLGNVENQILGVARGEEEVPGYMIPQMYFDYLRTHDARPMAGIFYHNAIDILSLAGLFGHMAFLLNDPHSDRIRHGEDIVALARFFETMGEIPQAEALYHKALTADLSEEIHWDTLQRLSFLLKRKGDWQAAIALWEQAAQDEQLYAFEEIAKYYEHQAKDIEEAHRWTVGAITILNSRHFPAYHYHIWQENLSHRLERLEKKLFRNSPN